MKITGTIIENQKSGMYIAFVNEYSGIVVQSSTLEGVKEKLDKTFIKFAKIIQEKSIVFGEPTQIA